MTNMLDVVDLSVEAASLDYYPPTEQWVCIEHGASDCEQSPVCAAADRSWLDDPRLDAFVEWADRKFAELDALYRSSVDAGGDRGDVPDGYFNVYSVADWSDATL